MIFRTVSATTSKLVVVFVFVLSNPTFAQNISWGEILRQDRSWYTSAEAQRIADQVVQFQYANGGWAKNIDMAQDLSDHAIDLIKENQHTTIDNGATHTQLRFLAKMLQHNEDVIYKEAFNKGIDYLLEAQYKNGGWPQFYPLREGYYSHITFNDNAMIGVLDLFYDLVYIPDYALVTSARKLKIAQALLKGVDAILDMQITIGDTLTVWCAQHDEHTLKPAKARAYELPSLSGGESVGILKFLMRFEKPTLRMQRAIKAGVIWFKNHKIENKRVKWIDVQTDSGVVKDRVVVKEQGAPPLWARFYDLETQEPIFVGRDGIVKSKLAEIERERRTGYNYISRYADDLLETSYSQWRSKLQN